MSDIPTDPGNASNVTSPLSNVRSPALPLRAAWATMRILDRP